MVIDETLYRISEVARLAGVSPATLRRWLREGKIQEPGRDRNSWRVWTQRELDRVVQRARSYRGPALQGDLLDSDTTESAQGAGGAA